MSVLGAVGQIEHGAGKRCCTQKLIAGLGPSDLIAPWVIKGAMDGPAIVAYIRDVLIPDIEPGTVVTLDILATHRNK